LPMNHLSLLLSPRIIGLRNSLTQFDSRAWKKTFIMGSLGLLFWLGMFLLSARVLTYFQSVEVIGDILAHHLLSMVLLTFFGLLIFSHIITALSNLYLSNDLELCHSTPVHLEELFLSRCVYTFVDSSWMVIIFGLPVIMAYAYVYQPGPAFYFTLLHMGLGTAIIAAGIGILLTMVLVQIFPAQRTKDIVMLLCVLVIAGLYVMFRFLRPERLVDPEAFFSIMQYMTALEAPDSPYLPTHWLTEGLWNDLSGSGLIGFVEQRHLFGAMYVWSSAAALIVINIWVAQGTYFNGYSKSQEAKKRRRGGQTLLDLCLKSLSRLMPDDLASVMDKDVRTFFRDNTQWSQLLLLGALVAVYLYNFSVLPLDRSPLPMDFLQNQIAFLNMGLAGFVLSAIGVRFIFPAISGEGGAFWILRSSPLSMKRFLWGKYVLYLIPMLVLGEILVISTNHLLHVSRFMMILSSATMFMAIFGIVALGIGIGALYPNFKFENIAQVSTGFGGVIYMIISATFVGAIIVLEAGPVFIIFMAGVRDRAISAPQWLFIISSFLGVLALITVTIYKPMKMGIKALMEYE
jgi:ABC-2 type transport system permease protein